MALFSTLEVSEELVDVAVVVLVKVDFSIYHLAGFLGSCSVVKID